MTESKAKANKIPWEIGALFICSKCGAKFNQPQMAEEIKSEVRKMQKAEESQGKIRIITSGCLGVCFPEKQTLAFMPVSGATEVYTVELDREAVRQEVLQLLKSKIG